MTMTTRTETFPAPKSLTARLRNRAGDITITQAAGDEIRVVLRGHPEILEQIEVGLTDAVLTVDATHLPTQAPDGLIGALFQAITGQAGVDVHLEIPAGSTLDLKGGSGDVTVNVALARARVDVGSGDVRLGDVTGEADLRTGSGDVRLDCASSVQARTASGDVTLILVSGAVQVSSGSGDLHLGRAGGPVDVKLGSGDITVGEVTGTVSVLTGSGDLRVDRMGAGSLGVRTGAGDISLGVQSGLPVWTDCNTMTGEVTSTLRGGGQPGEGEPFVELRATTVAGDIRLFEG